LPVSLVEPCKQAIQNANEGLWDKPVTMPEGFRQDVTTSQLVEGCHLEAFLEAWDE
jgi:hypothetical protein